MAHARQSRPDSGLEFQEKVLDTFQVAPSSLGCGLVRGAGGGRQYLLKRGSDVADVADGIGAGSMQGGESAPPCMRMGSTSFGACEVRCWRCSFGN